MRNVTPGSALAILGNEVSLQDQWDHRHPWSRGSHGDLSPGQPWGCFQPLPRVPSPERRGDRAARASGTDLLGRAFPFLTVLCAFCSILASGVGGARACKRQPSWNLRGEPRRAWDPQPDWPWFSPLSSPFRLMALPPRGSMGCRGPERSP